MNGFLGFLTIAGIAGYFWYKNPQVTPLVLTFGGGFLGVLVFLALVCYGFQMLRLFFKF